MRKNSLRVKGRTLEEIKRSFESMAIKRGECWEWPNLAHGYGRICFGGKRMYAHRFAWFLRFGAMPARELKICHDCDSKSCVRYDHLFQGTQLENIRDARVKGRLIGNRTCGSVKPQAKITEETVRMLRSEYAKGVSIPKLSRKVGLSYASTYAAVIGKTWRHVEASVEQFFHDKKKLQAPKVQPV